MRKGTYSSEPDPESFLQAAVSVNPNTIQPPELREKCFLLNRINPVQPTVEIDLHEKVHHYSLTQTQRLTRDLMNEWAISLHFNAYLSAHMTSNMQNIGCCLSCDQDYGHI